MDSKVENKLYENKINSLDSSRYLCSPLNKDHVPDTATTHQTTHSRYLVELADNLNRYLYTEHLIVTSGCCQLPSRHQSQSWIVGLDFQGLRRNESIWF